MAVITIIEAAASESDFLVPSRFDQADRHDWDPGFCQQLFQ